MQLEVVSLLCCLFIRSQIACCSFVLSLQADPVLAAGVLVAHNFTSSPGDTACFTLTLPAPHTAYTDTDTNTNAAGTCALREVTCMLRACYAPVMRLLRAG